MGGRQSRDRRSTGGDTQLTQSELGQQAALIQLTESNLRSSLSDRRILEQGSHKAQRLSTRCAAVRQPSDQAHSMRRLARADRTPQTDKLSPRESGSPHIIVPTADLLGST